MEQIINNLNELKIPPNIMEGIIIGILCFYKKDEKKRKEVNVNYAITAQENIEREHFFKRNTKEMNGWYKGKEETTTFNRRI